MPKRRRNARNAWSSTQVIDTLFNEMWDFQPRDYQRLAVEALAYRSADVLMVQATGSGKTEVAIATALLLHGYVTLVVVPLLGLGAEQAERAEAAGGDHILAFHLDELDGDAAREVAADMMLWTSADPPKRSVVVFASPQALGRGSNHGINGGSGMHNVTWPNVIDHLVEENLLGLVVIDEAHCVPLQSEHFRTEFADLRPGRPGGQHQH